MEKRKFNSTLRRAIRLENQLNGACDDLADMFQPYFDDDISVLYQSSDGFVILHNLDVDDKSNTNLNTGVKEAFDIISKDENHFRR